MPKGGLRKVDECFLGLGLSDSAYSWPWILTSFRCYTCVWSFSRTTKIKCGLSSSTKLQNLIDSLGAACHLKITSAWASRLLTLPWAPLPSISGVESGYSFSKLSRGMICCFWLVVSYLIYSLSPFLRSNSSSLPLLSSLSSFLLLVLMLVPLRPLSPSDSSVYVSITIYLWELTMTAFASYSYLHRKPMNLR